MTKIHLFNVISQPMWQQKENQINSSKWYSKLLQRFTVTVTLLTLTIGCIPIQKSQSKIPSTLETNSISNKNCSLTPSKENNSQIFLISQNSNSTQCASIDPFSQAVRFATTAANLTQSAKTKQDWDQVAQQWVQAVAWMQAVPPENPRRTFAERKVAEYMKNLAYAQQKAASASSQFNPVSFNNDILDAQLKLYLSYVAIVGVPDVLIVGSSRAISGVDPQKLQQYLIAKGYPRLNMFNFGINGATAQVVDFQLRQLLSYEQLPKLIIWADGVRAFNSGRADRTYNSIVASEGKRLLLSGVRPQLPRAQSNFASVCYQFPQPYNYNVFAPNLDFTWETSVEKKMKVDYSNIKPTNNTKYSYKQTFANSTSYPQYSTQLVEEVAIANIENNIEANGFLPMDGIFNPASYYQQRPYVAGLYDGDYANFYLGGIQATAFNAVVNFTKSRNIPLVFVNLPLSDSYLDSLRWSAEQEFEPWMQRQAREKGFIFLNINLYQPELARNQYFFDPSHINRYGADAVSRYIAARDSIPWPR
ncbi:DUF1574 family protein [Okeania sp.]|uniref:DUF1574 family protein n=1 Tax=Okeania sp. TaxID=3100323 RepID=UPI002B4B76A4|nr:DUF1574 family protein [Okeania sp.]MEB3343695.1 DUF1574 family protein [Okeania sp.]